MVTDKELTHISKFLSLVLRHKPETIGIELDEQGWTDIEALIARSNEHGIRFDREVLMQVVETNAKKRFAVSESGDKIRASQGHSVSVELGYTSQRPPDILYHGTGAQSVASILERGLEKGSRHHVHLSSDRATAEAVGRRHGKPYLFVVPAGKMYEDGFGFYLSDNGVWLTEHVPVQYLQEAGQ